MAGLPPRWLDIREEGTGVGKVGWAGALCAQGTTPLMSTCTIRDGERERGLSRTSN